MHIPFKILPLLLCYFVTAIGMEQQTELTRYLESIPPGVRTSKKNLHADFYYNAKINDQVSYIYYPTAPGGDVGHAKLEIEGFLIDPFGVDIREPKFLDTKILKSKKENHDRYTPFYRFPITVSPDQLNRLKNDNRDISGTCSYITLAKLSKNCDLNVPLPCSLMPLLSAIYLYSAKKMDNDRIKNIVYYQHEIPSKNRSIGRGICGELVHVAVGTGLVIFASSHLL